jgi:hypothetical protein
MLCDHLRTGGKGFSCDTVLGWCIFGPAKYKNQQNEVLRCLNSNWHFAKDINSSFDGKYRQSSSEKEKEKGVAINFIPILAKAN